MHDSETPLPPCVICGNPAVREHRPFCSKRCADVDLWHWLSGSYAIPAVKPSVGSDEEDAAALLRLLPNPPGEPS